MSRFFRFSCLCRITVWNVSGTLENGTGTLENVTGTLGNGAGTVQERFRNGPGTVQFANELGFLLKL